MSNTLPAPAGSIDWTDDLCNAEFLVKAGFSQPTAEEMVTKWHYLREKFPALCPMLPGYAIQNLDDQFGNHGYNISGDACGPNDDYGAAWLAMGVEPSLLPRLLAEEHRPIRLLTTASIALQESIRATSDYMRAVSTREREVAKRQHHAKIQAEVDLPAEIKGHKMLYKVGPVFDLEDVWCGNETGATRLDMLPNKPPTDFDRLSLGMIYTLAQLEVAELQCSYKASFARHGPFGILHIAVPEYLLTEQSNFLHVDNSAHWRKMIWQCRGPWTMPPSFWNGLSEDVAHYTAHEQVGVAGSICAQSTALLKQLSNETQVRPLKLANGEEAKQYVALPASYNDLNDGCEGLVWLEERRLREDGMSLMPSSGKAMTRAMRQ